MKKISILCYLLTFTFFNSQKLSDAFILEKILGQDINKATAIMKLKKSPESKTTLGLTSNYYPKGLISYAIIERVGNDIADVTYFTYNGKDEVTILDNLIKEAFQNNEFQPIKTYFKFGREKMEVENYDAFLKIFREHSSFVKSFSVYSYFKKGDFYYFIQSFNGLIYVHVLKELPKYL